ncbi:MAG: 6-phosphogluconolactonase [Mycobacteriales bacterium]
MAERIMNIETVPSLAEPVGRHWLELQREQGDNPFFLAAPLSGTPLPVYQWVIRHAKDFASWHNARFVLMDEQVEGSAPPLSYVCAQDPASYEGFARRHFLGPLAAASGQNIEVVKPSLAALDEFDVTIDLLILALGVAGNYANVMPNTPLDAGWHIAQLAPEFRHAHTQQGRAYEGATFREYGMSLGHQQVLAAKNILVITSGAHKQALTKQLLSFDAFDPSFPLSIIHHADAQDRVTVYISEDAGTGLALDISHQSCG